MELTTLKCDNCKKLDPCRFQWLASRDNFPFQFCSEQCQHEFIGWYKLDLDRELAGWDTVVA